MLLFSLGLTDGPGPEGSDQPHVWCTSAPQEETDHLLQHLPPALQLHGKKVKNVGPVFFSVFTCV